MVGETLRKVAMKSEVGCEEVVEQMQLDNEKVTKHYDYF